MMGEKPSFYVIDDDSVLRSLIRGILSDAGFLYAGSAVNGEEGLKGCQDKSPTIVLLDINLPGSDGIDVLAALRRMRRPPRVVMVSGEATLPRVKSAMSLGACGFVVKPFTAAKLITAVENSLRQRDSPIS
ncbi:response regulator [Chitinimonas arctica]|uniref:Response regulator n=1 Tax=Chitinimonas arctica TaxID=2594795 RepID=A0A516SDM0_9NEIS|nr:response regulator [Chitinimonas arctica]QDQ26239.1 response regulator [Chitinimonas arctica]